MRDGCAERNRRIGIDRNARCGKTPLELRFKLGAHLRLTGTCDARNDNLCGFAVEYACDAARYLLKRGLRADDNGIARTALVRAR